MNDRGGVTITGYAGQSKTVKIPAKIDGNPVTNIETRAFSSHGQLTSVIIPNSVTSIAGSFSDNRLLTSVTIGANVTIYNDSFGRDFYMVYNNGGKQAGTYVKNGGSWSKK